MSPGEAEGRPTTHTNFDYNNGSGGGDTVTFISSDRVLFHLHRKNLDVTAGVFPGPEFAVDPRGQESAAIPLQEPASVLEALFQFVYPDRRAKLAESLEFNVLAQVAEAAEKYQIYSAIDACEQEFKIRWLPEHAVPILTHAIKHGSTKLIDASALCLCIAPISEVLNEGFPLHLAAKWSKYHEDCRDLLFKDAERGLMRLHLNSAPGKDDDRSCIIAAFDWMHSTRRDVSSLSDFEREQYKPDMFRHDEVSPMCSVDLDMAGQPACYTLWKTVEQVKNGIRQIKKISFSDRYLNEQPGLEPMSS